MSEAEAIELMQGYVANAIGCFTIYASFTFAYLTMAFIVGARLTKFQAIFVSILYFVFALAFTVAFGASIHAYALIMAETETVIEKEPLLHAKPWIPFIALVQMSGALASLYFMYDIRRRGTTA